MTKPTLEELAEKHPHLSEFFGYIEKLNTESERGAVLISTGYLEQQLKNILAAFFVENEGASELLDGGYAPLGSFSARITACHALGLILPEEHHDLHLLRKIRNSFAHNIHTSFETRSVVDRCALLKHKARQSTAEEDKGTPLLPVGQFKTAAVGLIVSLNNRPHHVAKERRAPKWWPID